MNVWSSSTKRIHIVCVVISFITIFNLSSNCPWMWSCYRAPRSRDYNSFAKKIFRHITYDFRVGLQHHRCFAYARLADYHEVIFIRLPEYLKYRVQSHPLLKLGSKLAFFCHLCRVSSELIKGGGRAPSFSYEYVPAASSRNLLQARLRPEGLHRGFEVFCPLFPLLSSRRMPSRKMFASYITVTDEPCFFYSEFKDFLHAG